MAGFTTSALNLFVHVKEMQIQVSVSEVGKSLGLFLKSNVFAVTFKTNSVVVGFIWHIEFFGEVLHQHSGVLTTMSVMARAAISVTDRSVLMLLS